MQYQGAARPYAAAFMNLEASAGDGKYLPARLAALVAGAPPSEELCNDARNVATGLTARSPCLTLPFPRRSLFNCNCST